MAIINGLPLFVHAINYAKRAKLVDEIYVSSDSTKIKNIANGEGVYVIHRRSELCRDASTANVIYHSIP
ncbi:MAG: acylneuraminate cytidylyltransferase family protein, partial [Bacteroidetes bacterium]|nr:acylneuraminate cytidylyltransferase family protein [Bacteroidota bacterium]